MNSFYRYLSLFKGWVTIKFSPISSNWVWKLFSKSARIECFENFFIFWSKIFVWFLAFFTSRGDPIGFENFFMFKKVFFKTFFTLPPNPMKFGNIDSYPPFAYFLHNEITPRYRHENCDFFPRIVAKTFKFYHNLLKKVSNYTKEKRNME